MNTKKFYATYISVILGCIAMISCEDKEFTPAMPEALLINEIKLNVTPILPLAIGMDSTLSYTISPENIADKKVLWKSFDETIATVSQNGTIKGISIGEAIVTISPAIGFGSTDAVKTIKVKVVPEIIKATGIVFTNTETSIYETDLFQLRYNILPYNHTYDYLTWKSSDATIASVSENGLVTGLKSGNVTITAYTNDRSGVKASYNLEVKPYIPVEVVTIQPYSKPLCINEPIKLDFTYSPVGATAGSVTWTSSDENIVKVNQGLLTPTGFGTVTIVAKCKGNESEASVSITVDGGWYKWDVADGFNGWAIATPGASSVIANGKMTVTMKQNPTNWRGDIKYSGLPNSFGGNRPILAIKGTMPSVGSRKWDAIAATPGGNVNSGSPNQTGTKTANDGIPVYYYDMVVKIPALATGLFPFPTFQFKMADFPIPSSSGKYDVYWIRTFKNVADLDAFIAAE